jgi:hypothetical protein
MTRSKALVRCLDRLDTRIMHSAKGTDVVEAK